jgi:hypothetical protein
VRVTVQRAALLAIVAALPACTAECGKRSNPSAPTLVVPHRGGTTSEPVHTEVDAAAATSPPVPTKHRPTRDASFLDLTAYATAKPLSGKSVGHTSIVYKLKLEGGLTAAYKPASSRGPTRYKGEVAAYRLGLALGLDNVPPAMPRSYPLAELRAAVGADGKSSDAGAYLAKEVLADGAGQVKGALIPWIDKLSFMAIEADPLLSEWKRWLRGDAQVPDDKVSLAGQISTLIAFDYVTGNWDRWSGGNVGYDAATGTLLFIDNDAAFFEVPPAGLVSVQKARLDAVGRFSKSFVMALRKLDAPGLTKAMGTDGDAPLLSEKALAGVMTRRDATLAAIDARVAAAGADATLVFE